ncbi:hypothetical protein ACF0H5_008089 [Mactra antiquata]
MELHTRFNLLVFTLLIISTCGTSFLFRNGNHSFTTTQRPVTPPTPATPGVATATAGPGPDDLSTVEELLIGILVVVTAILLLLVGRFAFRLYRKHTEDLPRKYENIKTPIYI